MFKYRQNYFRNALKITVILTLQFSKDEQVDNIHALLFLEKFELVKPKISKFIYRSKSAYSVQELNHFFWIYLKIFVV